MERRTNRYDSQAIGCDFKLKKEIMVPALLIMYVYGRPPAQTQAATPRRFYALLPVGRTVCPSVLLVCAFGAGPSDVRLALRATTGMNVVASLLWFCDARGVGLRQLHPQVCGVPRHVSVVRHPWLVTPRARQTREAKAAKREAGQGSSRRKVGTRVAPHASLPPASQGGRWRGPRGALLE